MYQDMYDPATFVAGNNAPPKMRRSPSRLRGQGRNRNFQNHMQIGARRHHDPHEYDNNYHQMDDGYGDYHDGGYVGGYDDRQDGHDGYNGGYDDSHGGYDEYDDGYDGYDDNQHYNQRSYEDAVGISAEDVTLPSAFNTHPTVGAGAGAVPLNLETSDQAFQMTAKLVVDYLSPKMEANSSSYYLDDADIIFLEAVVPEEIRTPFVNAVISRSKNIAAGNPSSLESLVKECKKLGLGQENSFLVGGGTKMDDGRILVEVVENKEEAKNDNGPDFIASDQAFEMTAKLITDFLSPKLQPGASSYHVDEADSIYLDAVVPNAIRPSFVDAIIFRATSLPDESTSSLSPIQTLVKECVRLGLNKKECFLLGGGMKMADGRILVLPGGSKLGAKKKKKKKKKQPAQPKSNERIADAAAASGSSPINGAPNGNMTSLANSGLSPEQMKLVLLAMSTEQSSDPKKEEEAKSAGMKVSQPKTQDEKTMKKPGKIPMDSGRRKRTSKGQASLPPIVNDGASQTKKKIGRKNKDGSRGIMRSSSNVGQAQKDVIGGIKRVDSSARSDRALNRRMRSIERRSRIGLYVENETNEESPIQMNWRDDVWDFAKHGILHKFLFLSFVAPLFALGQIQTRSKLTWLGLPAESNYDAEMVFTRITTFITLHILSNAGLVYGIYYDWTQGLFNTTFACLLVVVNFIYFIVLVVACGNTRWTIRRRNNIPQLFELADYLMPLFYLPFVIAQLGRHTVDYSVYKAQIFSQTGLPHGVEIPSETKYVQPQIVQNEDSVMV